MVWYGAGIRKLGDGDERVAGGGTEIKVSIPSHPIPIPFRWEYHPNTFIGHLIWASDLDLEYVGSGAFCGSYKCGARILSVYFMGHRRFATI